MDTIIILYHEEIARLKSALNNGGTYKLRVAIEGNNVKFKTNEYMWSPPMGKLDPSCERALR